MGLWRVLSDLEEDGYRTEFGLFSAEETGAPHQRIRVFILAHTASREPRQSQARNGGQDIGGGSEEELADCDNQRCDREQISVQSGRSQQEGAEIMRSSRATRWPARPGEEQYAWEEPRVVADRSVKRCGGRKNKDGKDGEGISEQEGEERPILWSKTEGCSGDGETANDEAQSELGGAVDGLTHRVDRLRLLGNGVVPQTAEIAWRTLWQRI